ncbi:MAG: sugar phosphate isomerase/epimerase, partial [Planctomycetota bacterium]|nr:sugar phosphate isomerase/epimerase [Planctomycetota bacterium]
PPPGYHYRPNPLPTLAFSRAVVKKSGLKLFALCSDRGKGFFSADARAANVEFTMAAVRLAADLGTGVVTSHIGHVPEDAGELSAGKKALYEIGEHAKYLGVTFATETGPEDPPALAALLNSIGSEGLGVNYDPANLVGNGFDHIEGVRHLAKRIKHTHAKDRKRGGPEVPLGEGDVDFPKWTSALRAAGYEGPLTIEREGGEDRVGEIRRAVEFLRKLP